MKRVYVQSRNDDGGLASRDWHSHGDSAAASPRSEFVEVLRPEGSPTDVVTIRRGSMTSVPGVPAIRHTDTQIPARVHTLSIAASSVTHVDSAEVSA